MLARKILMILAFSLGSSVASAGTTTPTRSTEAVWNHHIAAWETHNLEAIVSDYGDDSILILNGTVFRGQNAIKSAFAQLFQIFDAGQNRIDAPLLLDRLVYITWHFTPTKDVEFYGTDTFVIEDGVIAIQTIASPLYDEYRVEK